MAIILLALTDNIKKKRYQRIIGVASLVPLFSTGLLTVLLPIEYWEIVFLITGELFLLFTAFRLLFSKRLRGPHATAKDTGQLAIIMLVSVACVFLPQILLLWLLLTTIALVTIAMLFQFRDGIHKYVLEKQSPRELRDLPTVSVCIPARNETHALSDCLTSILESDYPKLEIIVLDDCSQDKTSRVIHSFAHDGVRFVQGSAPSDGWLGKNQALQVLSKQATGKYLLFIGVDTRLSANTISQLVDYVQDKKLSMISVLPRKSGRFALDTLFSTLRYFWQLTTPRFVDMPTASSLWLIRAGTLEKLGGFKKVAHDIEPERIFAHMLATKHTYRFLVGTYSLGAFYAKKWSSQIETGVRLWYPLLDMQPSRVYLAAFGQYLFNFLPYIVIIFYLFTQQHPLAALVAAVIIVLQYIIYALYIVRTQAKGRVLAVLCLPLVALQETALILTSIVQYEFGTVNWKGRNICYPVLSLRSWRD